jgi:uncharacterized phosphatase
MPNSVVYLIRHSAPEQKKNAKGQPLQYGPEAALTSEGSQKAAKLADAILTREGGPLEVIYSSPYQRAYETASILAEKMGIGPVRVIADLHDTANTWAGTPTEELIAVVKAGKLFEDPRTMETPEEIADRMVKAYAQILASHPGQRVGVVSHGDPLRLLYYRIHTPDQPIPPYLKMPEALSLQVAEGARLEYCPDGKIKTEKI